MPGEEKKKTESCDCPKVELMSEAEIFYALDPLFRPNRHDSLQQAIEKLQEKGFTVCRRKSE